MKKKKIKEDEILFFHGYTNDRYASYRGKHHRITIAGSYKDVVNGRCLRIALSICEPNDQFRKQKGREQAVERLKNPYGLGNIEICMRFPEGQELSHFNSFANSFQNYTSMELQQLFGFEEMKAVEEAKKTTV